MPGGVKKNFKNPVWDPRYFRFRDPDPDSKFLTDPRFWILEGKSTKNLFKQLFALKTKSSTIEKQESIKNVVISLNISSSFSKKKLKKRRFEKFFL